MAEKAPQILFFAISLKSVDKRALKYPSYTIIGFSDNFEKDIGVFVHEHPW